MWIAFGSMNTVLEKKKIETKFKLLYLEVFDVIYFISTKCNKLKNICYVKHSAKNILVLFLYILIIFVQEES